MRLKELLENASRDDRNLWGNDSHTNFPFIPFACFGQYDSSCAVERSNFIHLANRLYGENGVYFYNGYHPDSPFDYIDVNAIYIDVEVLSRDARWVIEDYLIVIQDYPSMDDNLLYNVEEFLTREAFNYDIEWEFEEELSKREIDELWEKVVGGMGHSSYVESGGSVYIDWDMIKRGI